MYAHLLLAIGVGCNSRALQYYHYAPRSVGKDMCLHGCPALCLANCKDLAEWSEWIWMGCLAKAVGEDG